MKTSQLIKKLQSLMENHGDNELEFYVNDYYSRYGNEMVTDLKCGENSDMPSDWSGVSSNGNRTMISFHLKNKEGMKPKITFRKQ